MSTPRCSRSTSTRRAITRAHGATASLAGERAEAAFANVVAAELFERALAAVEHLDDVPASERMRVCEALGDVCERFADYDRARTAYGKAAAALPDDDIVATRMIAKTGILYERSGRYDEALESYENALADLERIEGEDDAVAELRAQISIGQAGIRYRQARYEESITAALAAIEHAEQAGNRSRVAHASYILDAAYTDLGTAEGLPYLERALPIYEELRDFRGQGIVLSNLGCTRTTKAAGTSHSTSIGRAERPRSESGDVIGAAVQMNNEARDPLRSRATSTRRRRSSSEWLRTCRASGSPFGVGVALVQPRSRGGEKGSLRRRPQGYFDDALRIFEQLGSERFANETRARRRRMPRLRGQPWQRRSTLALACREAATEVPGRRTRGADRAHDRARAVSGRSRDEASPHLEESLELAASPKGRVRGGPHSAAMASVGLDGADASARGAESDGIFERLGVVSVPNVPLP